MDILDEVSGFILLLSLLSILILSILSLRLAQRTVNEALNHLDDAAATMESYPTTVGPTAWTPLMVGVVGSLFQIQPVEILSEYKKEHEGKRSIVINTFPDSELTKKFLEGQNSKFMSMGYTFKQEDSLQNPGNSSESTMPSKN